MSQQYVVPNIYQDMSNQSQGYFAFRFVCQQCGWAVDTMPIRSSVSTVTNVMDIGVSLLGGYWGRAAEAGEQIYGSRWHSEQADALQKSWAQIQHQFHFCPKCHITVCNRCFNPKLNLCTRCAPDLKADGASFQHEMNIDAQRKQIQENYHAPQFNVAGIPSAVEEMPAPMQLDQPQHNAKAAFTASPATAADTQVMCPTCRCMGTPGKFCQDCGTKLPQFEAHCPQCSSQVEVGARFCPECGTKLQLAT